MTGNVLPECVYCVRYTDCIEDDASYTSLSRRGRGRRTIYCVRAFLMISSCSTLDFAISRFRFLAISLSWV